MSTTSFDEFYSRFYDKVENDPDFFDYYNHTSDESMEIAQERAKSYLNEAIDIFTLKCTPTVNFFDIDTEDIAKAAFNKYGDIEKIKQAFKEALS